MVTKRVATGKKTTRKKTDSVVNPTDGAAGHSDGAAGHADGAAGHADGAAGHTDGAAGHADGAASHTDGAAGHSGGVASHAAGTEFPVPESTPPVTTGATDIDPDARRQMVAAEAYFRAERRGFAAGGELDDWVAAEEAVASRFGQQQVA